MTDGTETWDEVSPEAAESDDYRAWSAADAFDDNESLRRFMALCLATEVCERLEDVLPTAEAWIRFIEDGPRAATVTTLREVK